MPSGPAVDEKARVIAEEPLKARGYSLTQQQKTADYEARSGGGEDRALGGGRQTADNVKHRSLLLVYIPPHRPDFKPAGAA
jgi:hypothetical protein